MELHESVAELARGFEESSRMLMAIGDEARQHLILEMLKIGDCRGVRVCEITKTTNPLESGNGDIKASSEQTWRRIIN